MGYFDAWREKRFMLEVRRAFQSVGWTKPTTELGPDSLGMDAEQFAAKAAMFRRRMKAKFGVNYPASVEPYIQHIRRQREHRRRTGQPADTVNTTYAMLDLLSAWVLVENRPQAECIMLMVAWAELDARGSV